MVVTVPAQQEYTTSYTSTLNFGDNSATDLTTTAGVTTADNPWVEFSADITSGDPPPAGRRFWSFSQVVE